MSLVNVNVLEMERHRHLNGWTKTRLSNKAKVHLNTIRNIVLNGVAKSETVFALAKALNIDPRILELCAGEALIELAFDDSNDVRLFLSKADAIDVTYSRVPIDQEGAMLLKMSQEHGQLLVEFFKKQNQDFAMLRCTLYVEHSREEKSRKIQKVVNTLDGLLLGIATDDLINDNELIMLRNWLDQFPEYTEEPTFKRANNCLAEIARNDISDPRERAQVFKTQNKVFLENRPLLTNKINLDRLRGIVNGIILDGIIEKDEIIGLTEWMVENQGPAAIYPFPEIFALVSNFFSFETIDDREHELLLKCLSFFSGCGDPCLLHIEQEPVGICLSEPEITFENKSFCFTGEWDPETPFDVDNQVRQLRGRCTDHISTKVDYLVVGSGNIIVPCFCTGNKVEQAVTLRRQGAKIAIVRESDFVTALQSK